MDCTTNNIYRYRSWEWEAGSHVRWLHARIAALFTVKETDGDSWVMCSVQYLHHANRQWMKLQCAHATVVFFRRGTQELGSYDFCASDRHTLITIKPVSTKSNAGTFLCNYYSHRSRLFRGSNVQNWQHHRNLKPQYGRRNVSELCSCETVHTGHRW